MLHWKDHPYTKALQGIRTLNSGIIQDEHNKIIQDEHNKTKHAG